MTPLPDDILVLIFSFLTQNALLKCRCLSRATEYLATSLAFRHVRLELFCDPLPFVRIAESSKLRPLVREITIDAWQGPTPDGHDVRGYIVRRTTKFLLALPLVRLLSGLQAVNIKFTQSGASVDTIRQLAMLSTIVKCVTGRWTEELHETWQKSWLDWFMNRMTLYSADNESHSVSGGEFTDLVRPFTPVGQLLSLSSLTIANLTENTEHALYESPEFQELLSAQFLKELKLLVATRRSQYDLSEQIFLPEKYDFFDNLPKTWLSPVICSNLRVLSLYCREYFGWAPKLDVRMLGLGNGTSPFPNLRVLALGNYVFSHEWQIDWIASLGADNGRGGLEELYLDDCPIMWRAHVLGPMDESILDVNGVQIANTGYPLKEVMTRQSPHDERWDPVTVKFHLRWSTVLDIWRNKMKTLKVFRMGSGDWEGKHTVTVATARTMDLTGDLGSKLKAQPAWKRRCEDVVHINYDKRSMAEFLQHNESNLALQHGLGLSQSRESVLQYVHFHVGLGWVERDFGRDMMDGSENGWQLYEASRKADEEALRQLLEAVDCHPRK
ncbi:hypothetical protein N0V93_006012 [Gnomoniopsis smithogilvyi]|uniref:F-box domain-containing protein n=1 Tax=Gnomoniopsis smithogilvyi TaxID=1191159 RepID=A0A9W8YP20_9PEZI|nr:hypothetical protein N0V93_006012 [Gnomoniopsis smithogilvyi]